MTEIESNVAAELLIKSGKNHMTKARLRSIRGKQAGAWLTALPTTPALTLSDLHFRVASRLRLGLPPQDHLPANCKCGANLRTDPHHFLSCKYIKRAAATHRHNMILNKLSFVLSKAGAAVYIEPNWFEGKRPDAQVNFVHENVMIDASVTHPSSPSLCQGAANKPLSAAEKREKQKIAKYDELAKSEECRFVPFVLESFGSFGNRAIKFIREIRLSSIEPHAATPITAAYIVRILAITLQAGNAATLLSGCLQAREWNTALRRQRAHLVNERVDKDNSDAEEADEVRAEVSDDEEEEIGHVISAQMPDSSQPAALSFLASLVSETSSSETENKIGSAGDSKGDEIPATQVVETDLVGTAESEGKQAASGVTSESKDEVVIQVSGGSDEAQADSVSETIIVHNENDGTRSPTRSPDPNPKRRRRDSK
eukprot:TRINITY_DN3993_c0_g2_i4.p1 TRINITY_DN3993_c0_g2~~TRINITY_DN3993_c0_g2_i4.p1  ORF type:complete len:427 (-),score=23.61 TRINITY_DN3993_c0_g2_i4:53-1333(-)